MPYTPPGAAPDDDATRETRDDYRDTVQERQVRLTAQRILTTHLLPGEEGRATTFWPDTDLDLTGATLIDLTLTDCHIRQAQFTGTHFAGIAELSRVEFVGDARFAGAEFAAYASFTGTRFASHADFKGATFTGEARFSRARFADGAVFTGARFASHARFEVVEFVRTAQFGETRFADDATFTGARFAEGAGFEAAEFTGHAGFLVAGAQHSVAALGHCRTRGRRNSSTTRWPKH